MNISLLLLIAIIVILMVLLFRQKSPADTQSALLLKQDLNRLSDDISNLKTGLQTQMGDRFDRNQQMMMGSLQRQFSESSKLINEVTRNLTELKESNKQVLGITDELKTLQNVLQNPKQRGVLGEYHLQSLLENILPPERFKLQHKLGKTDDNRDLICDAVVLLDKGMMLPVDSKFSLENYNRLIESKDKLERESLVKLFRTDLKNRIDETSKYIRPKDGTMDFAFMFIPSEAIYYDLLINKIGATGTASRDMIEYAFREKNVIIVSPTSFMAYLQTVLQGLRSLQIEETAKEIQQRVGELGRHIGSYEVFMQKLGSSLGVSVGHYNTAHKELRKIDKDVMKIAGTSPAVEPLILERPVAGDD